MVNPLLGVNITELLAQQPLDDGEGRAIIKQNEQKRQQQLNMLKASLGKKAHALTLPSVTFLDHQSTLKIIWVEHFEIGLHFM